MSVPVLSVKNLDVRFRTPDGEVHAVKSVNFDITQGECLGVQEPQTSLGTLISAGTAVAEALPWILIVPAIVLVTLLLCLTFVGDGLRDALDPKDR